MFVFILENKTSERSQRRFVLPGSTSPHRLVVRRRILRARGYLPV